MSGCWPRPAFGWAMRCLRVRWVWGKAVRLWVLPARPTRTALWGSALLSWLPW